MSQNKFVNKFQDVLDKYFHKIFNNSHFFYTIIFFLLALIISLLSFINSTAVGDVILFLAIVTSITFILLMFEGLIPQLEKYLFSEEKKFDKWKLISFSINFFLSFILILTYFLLKDSIPIDFLKWDVLLPIFLIIIYFGWNLVQILFLKVGFEDLSTKIDDKITDKYGYSKKKDGLCLTLLIVAILTPILLQLGTFFGLFSYFMPPSGDPIDPLVWYIACNVIVLIVIIMTTWRLFTLYQRSKKNNSTNAFASIFYILIWIIIWFRTFSFLNSLRSITDPSVEMEIISRLFDVLMIVLTSIMVLRSLGSKVYDSILLNQNNMPFFLFSFMILYIEGQIIMITGAGTLTGIFADRNQINLINNFLIILVSISFYWWYSEHSLERKGFIARKRYYPEEVALVVNDFWEFLINKKALDPNKIGDEDVQSFLLSKNIELTEEKPVETKFEPKIEKDLSTDQE